jgi:hypothetical protein
MPNVLEGVEYRTLKSQLPSWRVEENYNEWLPCGSLTEFPSGTEFRVKEELEYVVTFNSRKDLSTPDKTKAMARVAKLIEDGFEVSVNKYAKTQPGIASFLSDNNIQFKLSGSDKWLNPPHFGGVAQGSPIRFRKRPDTYFEVQIKTGIAMSSLTFDDVDELSKYLDRQLRTSENGFTVTRRHYGITVNSTATFR